MNRKDVITIPIPDHILKWAKKAAVELDRENDGENTQDGGSDKNVKGNLGQWAVSKYLTDSNLKHTYEKPYVKEQYGDRFDIEFCGDIWDVKCRGWWSEEWWLNNNIFMTLREQKEAMKPDHKKTDYYIFCTVDKEWKNIYILGVKSFVKVWSELKDLTERELKHTVIDTAGTVSVRSLTPIKKHIWRA